MPRVALRLILPALALAILIQTAAADPKIFLVRHAEKTDADAKDPNLSEIGHARANALATTLKEAGISAVFATEYKRTQQTAAPLAALAHLEVTIVPGKETAALVAKLKATSGNALVVGHSNTIGEILKELGIANPPTIEDADYDNLFVLTPGPQGAELLRLHFGK